MWNNIGTNPIRLEYSVRKPIASNLELSKSLLDALSDQQMNIILPIAIVLLIVLMLGVWKRKDIGDRVEDYIISHSEIKSYDTEEG